MLERLTYWEGTIKAFPCGRKPLVLKVTSDLQFPRMVHFQLQCRRLTTSLAYSLALRSPWAETGEKNHVTHKFTPRKLYKLDLFWRKLKCRFFQVVSSLPSPPGLASAAGATATSLRWVFATGFVTSTHPWSLHDDISPKLQRSSRTWILFLVSDLTT